MATLSFWASACPPPSAASTIIGSPVNAIAFRLLNKVTLVLSNGSWWADA